MTISERIFWLFDQDKSKKQSALAAALGVRQNTISDWKAARRNPAAEHLEGIASFFGVSVNYLVTGHEYTPASVRQQGIFGDSNHGNTVTIGGDNTDPQLSEFESELLRIYGALDTEHKTALLMYAYEMSRKCNGEG